uniref:Uncharacterized protein n=1 Tax=Myotis myotis TaxID=51298 RepID=A0A7J7XH31_MYOMY|nr:hypothetical protein mMyoMyo1_011604 [Myotis myotis]
MSTTTLDLSPSTGSSPGVPLLRLWRPRVSAGILSTSPVIAPSHRRPLRQDHEMASGPPSAFPTRLPPAHAPPTAPVQMQTVYPMAHLSVHAQSCFHNLKCFSCPQSQLTALLEEVFPDPPYRPGLTHTPSTVLGSAGVVVIHGCLRFPGPCSLRRSRVLPVSVFVVLMFLFQRGRERKREIETSMMRESLISCLLHAPYWGLSPQPEHVP